MKPRQIYVIEWCNFRGQWEVWQGWNSDNAGNSRNSNTEKQLRRARRRWPEDKFRLVRYFPEK
jgi:hypothetical protein